MVVGLNRTLKSNVEKFFLELRRHYSCSDFLFSHSLWVVVFNGLQKKSENVKITLKLLTFGQSTAHFFFILMYEKESRRCPS